MKLTHYFFCSILILIFGFSTLTFANEDGGVTYDNSSSLTDFELKRIQNKVNRFVASQAYSGLLKVSESQLIGSMRVQNNTRDGFTVHLQSANKAVLMPVNSTDGEDNISYSLALSFAGETASQVYQETDTIDNTDFGDTNTDIYSTTYGALIFGNLAGVKCGAPTDMFINVNLNLDSVIPFQMAGEYLDTLTITYTDR
jgi:hypothetical protein